jgi:hypothetical protein
VDALYTAENKRLIAEQPEKFGGASKELLSERDRLEGARDQWDKKNLGMGELLMAQAKPNAEVALSVEAELSAMGSTQTGEAGPAQGGSIYNGSIYNQISSLKREHESVENDLSAARTAHEEAVSRMDGA